MPKRVNFLDQVQVAACRTAAFAVGDFEDETVYDPATQSGISLDRERYREIVELLKALGIQ
jgi:hypothetical protein